ncbi:MAG TPA: LytTR family DNA-binding domain-containing protein [Longimicrobiales bacterium]|nr:LytTR family DNA-binding domain-containing protein [Longimicrobiales bacterium]
MIRVVVVDDEPIARAGVVRLLGEDGEFDLVGEAGSGSEAVRVIEEEDPDLVLLDVQVPELNGFEVLAQLDLPRLPLVVFVTAYDEYALRAFEVSAVDYLLKPFDRERFQAALERVKQHFRTRDVDELRSRVRELLDRMGGSGLQDRLVVRDAGRVFFLGLGEVEWIEAAGNYVRVHAGKNAHLMRHTITGMMGKLPGNQFLRVSRSAIVNLKRVREVQSLFNGCFVFILHGGTRVESSRRFRRQIAAALAEDV